MLIEKTAWPQNKTCAAMISVNLDAEFFGKIYYPDVNVDEGDILRLGRTSLRYGLPKLLEVLDRYGQGHLFYTGSRCEALSGGGCLHRFAWA